MQQKLIQIVVLVLFVQSVFFSCARSDGSLASSKGNYEVVLVGSDPVNHKGGNLRLMRKLSNGKANTVWSYIVNDPVVVGELVVFNAGLSDDRKWVNTPALLAYLPGYPSVEITELITKKYSDNNQVQYSQIKGGYSYEVELSGEKSLLVRGSKVSRSAANGPVILSFQISNDEVLQWVQSVRKNAKTYSYNGNDYTIPLE